MAGPTLKVEPYTFNSLTTYRIYTLKGSEWKRLGSHSFTNERDAYMTAAVVASKLGGNII